MDLAHLHRAIPSILSFCYFGPNSHFVCYLYKRNSNWKPICEAPTLSVTTRRPRSLLARSKENDTFDVCMYVHTKKKIKDIKKKKLSKQKIISRPDFPFELIFTEQRNKDEDIRETCVPRTDRTLCIWVCFYFL